MPTTIISSPRDKASKQGLVRTNEKPIQNTKAKRGNANTPTLNIKAQEKEEV
jgi:hypothetical protein